jgi:molybdopterin-guanine dinucleotide biosynthesis protein A
MDERIHTGIVLAGGKSTRMGKDKGLISWKGRTLVEHAVEIIAPLCAGIIISSNNRDYEFLGFRVLPDQYRGQCGCDR